MRGPNAVSDLTWASVSELSGLIRTRQISPVEIVTHSLARLDAVEPMINAFVTATPDLALAAARRVEAAVMRGDAISPLAGIPISVKDNIAVKGAPVTFGSRATDHSAAVVSAPSVERLEKAGACIIGKTTMTEFGCKPSGDSPLTGLTRNPWNLAKSSGGSSSGAAASLAAGVSPIALGTDGGGSLRIPAAFCGVVGLKPQFGRVAVYPPPTAPSLLHVGPMARTVADAALLLDCISGFDSRDAGSFGEDKSHFVADCAGAVSDWKVGWSATLGFGKPDEDVLSSFESAMLKLHELPCDLEEIDVVFDNPYRIHELEFLIGATHRLRESLEHDSSILDQDVVSLLDRARACTIDAYAASRSERNVIRDRFHTLLGTYRVVVTPTLPVAAFDANLTQPPDFKGISVAEWPTYTAIHNLTGFPAISIPCGMTRGGLPVGMQIVGAPHREADVLAFAAKVELILPWAANRPPLF